jgi:hypothetical protein
MINLPYYYPADTRVRSSPSFGWSLWSLKALPSVEPRHVTQLRLREVVLRFRGRKRWRAMACPQASRFRESFPVQLGVRSRSC